MSQRDAKQVLTLFGFGSSVSLLRLRSSPRASSLRSSYWTRHKVRMSGITDAAWSTAGMACECPLMGAMAPPSTTPPRRRPQHTRFVCLCHFEQVELPNKSRGAFSSHVTTHHTAFQALKNGAQERREGGETHLHAALHFHSLRKQKTLVWFLSSNHSRQASRS